ncbi:NAD-binding protein [Paraburkholderia sp. D15]|uniref:L-threonate dehydrogenase n=1 Tax=Paraburkholderia sp. D15 TaxID=2880218 RepID=UPI002478BAEB|nr:L-threonate dehydrogenase [Paraburkholderia sp. D15]WGS53882.1 NAD-binding protein [Paraburkholderia sp. D15]WKF60585.1 L-threonate dehydrogenase [Paraburkholderia busanensis]
MSRKVGVIGLGAMGLGVARTLLRKGFHVHACDLRSEVVEAFAVEGGEACLTPREIGEECDVVISFVVNAAQTETVLFGELGAVPAMKKGSVVLVCSTVAPEFAQALGKRIEAAGLLMLEAPVSGGAARAASGELTLMTAGPVPAFVGCADVLGAISAKVYRLGDRHGAASKVKMVNQLLAGVHIAAAAEALALGIREGVDPEVLYEVIKNSAGNSWMFENRVPHILKGDYTPLSAVDIFVKDLGLVLDAASTWNFPLPLSEAAHQMFKAASDAGYGREDDSAVIKIFPGIDLPTPK